jgi:VWFA-related protein
VLSGCQRDRRRRGGDDREQKTLEALDDLIEHLEGTRDERSFVVLLSEGWRLFPRNENLARPLPSSPGAQPRVPGGPDPVGIENGRLKMNPATATGGLDSCDRERSLLAFTDHEVEFRRILQKANRANVSFYPVDARGLVVFDEPIGPRRPPLPSVDADRLRTRQTALRELAEQTDGTAVLNTNDVNGALERMLTDTGAYYLLRYYSTNTRLDGRFRRITVRVKRPGLDVRSRPGYLAPTEADMASSRVDALMNGAPAGHSTMPPALAKAFERTAMTRGVVPLRAEAVGGPGYIWFTMELDVATARQTEWQAGGKGRMVVEHERGDLAPIASDVTLDPGQRAISLVRPEGTMLDPGRYIVRFQLSPQGSGSPLSATIDAVVPDTSALLARSAVASRRGPTTGLQYQRTADPRYRRTERLRLEIPRVAAEAAVTAQLLNRGGAPMALTVGIAERLDESLQLRFVVADLTLAPLAQGEYIVQVAAEQDGKKEEVNYAFRIVP